MRSCVGTDGFDRSEYYDNLEVTRKQWEKEQARKPGERVEFRSSGTQQLEAQRAASAGSSAAAGGEQQPPVKRKSKWDSAGSDAKRAA